MRYFIALGLALLLTTCGRSDPTLLPAQGQWRLVNYWALWCTPCREEIPELNLVNETEGITVFGVNYDGKTGESLQQQRLELGISFPSLVPDPAAALGVPRPRVLPTTLVVNPEGELVDTLTGPQTQATLMAALAALGR